MGAFSVFFDNFINLGVDQKISAKKVSSMLLGESSKEEKFPFMFYAH